MNLYYIGDHYYLQSGTSMSPIYTEAGERSDWGFVQMALRRGDEVHIRQATAFEREAADAKLKQIKKRRKETA